MSQSMTYTSAICGEQHINGTTAANVVDPSQVHVAIVNTAARSQVRINGRKRSVHCGKQGKRVLNHLCGQSASL